KALGRHRVERGELLWRRRPGELVLGRAAVARRLRRRRLRRWLPRGAALWCHYGRIVARVERLVDRLDRRRRRDRHLPPDLDRGLAALVEALEGRLADDPVAGPAAELGPDDDLGLRPDDIPQLAAPASTVVLRRRRIERGVLDLERLQDGPDA